MAVLAIHIPRRKDTQIVCLRLPVPLSTNKLWRPTKSGRMTLTEEYRAWKKDAGWHLCSIRPPLGRVTGGYSLRISICPSETKCDLTNTCKAIEDLLEAHGVIDNDRNCRRLEMNWASAGGVIVTVISMQPRAAA